MKPLTAEMRSLNETLKLARAGTGELVAQLKKVQRANKEQLRPKTHQSNCVSSTCETESTPTGTVAFKAASAALSSFRVVFRDSFSSDLRRMLRSVLGSFTRQISLALGRAAGGGIGGGLLSTLVGGSLSLVLGKLFRRRQKVRVDNVVRSEVLNFPRLGSLDFATNPASRLLGGRAVARGPAFSVEVAYKDGAEDVVTAKVASRLADLNSMTGVI